MKWQTHILFIDMGTGKGEGRLFLDIILSEKVKTQADLHLRVKEIATM